MITLTRISMLTGKKNKMLLPITNEHHIKAEQARAGGMLIQDAYPTLSADQREFLLTGAVPEEWDEYFGK